jgi:hypothetical protein
VFASLIVTLLALLSVERSAAAPFRNLDFEDSPVAPGAPESDSAPTSELFPSWTVRFGETVQSTAFLN